ncbi:hypothetical protein CKA32_005041 [Geitlerinema sp. FC II]|nr:hypothetical protein CKA32_005041 [Geitlerinema sp. FC II]
MVTHVSPSAPSSDNAIAYPESDGQPMADNTVQFRWITVIHYNLAWLFADDPNVFVAGDLLWYPVEGNNRLRCAPDVMVVFGVPKGDRGSYLQWQENNIAPQVVFEILSPGNSFKEMSRKLVFYERYGVEEYYQYDPQDNSLLGWVRSNTLLNPIAETNGWVSPRLQIRFEVTDETLVLYRPDGQPFSDYLEVQRRLEAAESRATAAEGALQQERERSQRLEQLLRDSGIDPAQIDNPDSNP